MTPFVRDIVCEAATRHMVSLKLLLSPCRSQKLLFIRIEIAKTLRVHGYSMSKIGRALRRDHTTVIYYLGNGSRKPALLQRWHRPRVRHLYWIKPEPVPKLPKTPKFYLVPYAGADFKKYVWIERPRRAA